MNKKQKLLLGVLENLGNNNRLDKLTLMKIMFLIEKENTPKFAMYHFHPYKHGPFSFKMYSDLNYLQKNDYINEIKVENQDSYSLTQKGRKELDISENTLNFINNTMHKFPTLEKIIDYVYDKYPEYSCRSTRKYIPKPIILDNEPGIFLVGYEGVDIDEFMHKLILNNIQILIDIRYNPRSMKYNFNKNRLQKSLKNIEIEYIHIPELGIAPEFRKDLRNQQDYDLLFEKYRCELQNKKKYLQKIKNMAIEGRIALMCFEKDVTQCHRREVGNYLKNMGESVCSI